MERERERLTTLIMYSVSGGLDCFSFLPKKTANQNTRLTLHFFYSLWLGRGLPSTSLLRVLLLLLLFLRGVSVALLLQSLVSLVLTVRLVGSGGNDGGRAELGGGFGRGFVCGGRGRVLTHCTQLVEQLPRKRKREGEGEGGGG